MRDDIATNLSTSYCADQDVVSGEIIYLYDLTTSYPIDSAVFQESKFHIDVNFSTACLKAPSTPLDGSSSSVISGITTPFTLRYIDQNDCSV